MAGLLQPRERWEALRISSPVEGKVGLGGGIERAGTRERFSFHWKYPCVLDFIFISDLLVLESKGGFL